MPIYFLCLLVTGEYFNRVIVLFSVYANQLFIVFVIERCVSNFLAPTLNLCKRYFILTGKYFNRSIMSMLLQSIVFYVFAMEKCVSVAPIMITCKRHFSCTWNGKPCDYSSDISQTLTEFGVCYTFNSGNNSIARTVNKSGWPPSI